MLAWLRRSFPRHAAGPGKFDARSQAVYGRDLAINCHVSLPSPYENQPPKIKIVRNSTEVFESNPLIFVGRRAELVLGRCMGPIHEVPWSIAYLAKSKEGLLPSIDLLIKIHLSLSWWDFKKNPYQNPAGFW